ncbi:hypothetical protein VitviT2T_011937 [Vitis vinifera]
MCDCAPSTLLLNSTVRIRNLGFTTRDWNPRNHAKLSTFCNSHLIFHRNGGSRLISAEIDALNSTTCVRAIPNRGELGFKDEGKRDFGFETKGVDSSTSSAFDFLELEEQEGRTGEKSAGNPEDEDLVRVGGGSELEGAEKVDERLGLRSGRQVMRRSNMLAKQVISIRSALSLGFVSQLWVDTTSWMVLVIEVRPNLLSGELERFLLEDVSRVGDVVLVQDESVMDNEYKMLGLETLVGYNVVTPGRRNIGKVRGYTFNINSGAVESLELDSFGISLIPSSLVSTYALFVEDVLEVVSDTVIVHEVAASRIQRLTKGFWDARKGGTSIDEPGEYSDFASKRVRSDHSQSTRRNFRNKKFRPKVREMEDDWELPMDYL